MIELLCAAAGALVASLWWFGRMRRAVLAWQQYAKELKKQNSDAARLLRASTQQIGVLATQIRQLGYEPWPLPSRRKEARL